MTGQSGVELIFVQHIAVAEQKKITQDPLNIFYHTKALSIRSPISMNVHFPRSRNGSEFSFARVCSFLYRIFQAYHVQLVSVAVCEQRSAVSV